MLTTAEQAEQDRINQAHAFGLRLARLYQGDVERLEVPQPPCLGDLRAELDDLASCSRRRERCNQALQFACGGLIDGLDASMQRIADAAGDGREPAWGPGADRWMELRPAVEIHALSLALDDLLSPAQRARARITSP
jgi:hypothetical protein